ncbi:HpcH/HpaI aldolase/citrate lyase family protein [Chloroflexota bacterium]
MKKNVLRDLLNKGKPTLSTRMITTSPQIVEIIGHSEAFDFIELLGEYASWTVTDLDNFSRTVELFPNMSSMMKVEREPRLNIAQRALGAGIQNLLFADCDSAEEVEECIRYVRPLTPDDGGLHGSSMRRNVGYILEGGTEEWAKAMRDVVVEVMIESESALEQIDEILSVKGLDMIHFGPSDYSLSIGKVGKGKTHEIQKKHHYVIETALKRGIRPRVVIDSYQEAKEYLDMGVLDFCVGNDLGILYRWCLLNGEEMRNLLCSK